MEDENCVTPKQGKVTLTKLPNGNTLVTPAAPPPPQPVLKELETKGNPDAKILAEAFFSFVENGVTQTERQTIEQLDDVLKNADIVLSANGSSAVIAQADGKSFNIKAGDRSR